MRDRPDTPQEWASSTLTSSAALTTCTQVWLQLRLPRVSDDKSQCVVLQKQDRCIDL